MHPYDMQVTVPPQTAECWKTMFSMSPDQVVRFRNDALAKFRMKKQELEEEEEKIRSVMHKDVRAIVDKAIALFRYMLEEIQYDDLDVVNYLVTGVKTIGLLPQVSFWPLGGVPPVVSLETLLRNSRMGQEIMLDNKSAGDHDKEVWEETVKELEAGLLQGPFTPDQLAEKYGPLWTGARRFGFKQNDKVRPINDFCRTS